MTTDRKLTVVHSIPCPRCGLTARFQGNAMCGCPEVLCDNGHLSRDSQRSCTECNAPEEG